MDKTFDAADEAYKLRCYEQDGKNMHFYQQNAGRLGLAAGENAKNIEKTVASALAKFKNATTAQKQIPKTCTEKYHNQLKTQAFMLHKAQRCIGCGKMIRF